MIILIALLAVICSALGVVYTRHESRRAAVQLGLLEDQRDEFIAEWSRLQLEQAWLAGRQSCRKQGAGTTRMQIPEKCGNPGGGNP